MQVVHVRRDAQSAQEMVTLRASPSSVQGSVQEILVVCNLETLRNYPLSCCATNLRTFVRESPAYIKSMEVPYCNFEVHL